MTQGQQRGFDGTVVYRWVLSLPGGSHVYTWAATRADAIAKCLAHRKVTPVTVEPAPPLW